MIMKKLNLVLLAIAFVFAMACQSSPRQGTTGTERETDRPVAEAKYTCPMHPEVTSDQPGECPKCGMALVLSDSLNVGSDTLAL